MDNLPLSLTIITLHNSETCYRQKTIVSLDSIFHLGKIQGFLLLEWKLNENSMVQDKVSYCRGA